MKKKQPEINFGMIKCFMNALGYQVTDIEVKGAMATVYYHDPKDKKLKRPKKKIAKK